MIIPIPLAGATGGHRSVQFGSELTQNFYVEERDGRLGMFDFPGNKPLGTCDGPFRGHHVMNGFLYKICDTGLYRVDPSGTYIRLGGVSGDDFAVFADDGTNLFLTADTKLFQWNGAAISEVSTPVVNPHSIAYINRQFIVAGDNGIFATSDVADGSTYNPLNTAEAETDPDPLIRSYIFNQLVYQLGGETTELWYNSGTGNPPFARQDTALVNVGIAGRNAVTNSDQYLYWLGDDKKIHQVVGASKRTITGPDVSGGLAAAHFIEALPDLTNCYASHFVLEGQDFLLFHFPGSNALLFSETFNYWVMLKWNGAAVISVYGKNIVADKSNGNTYELDLETYTDNGEVRERIRTLPSFSGRMINHDGRVIVKKLRINMQLGVGLETGQGVDPKLMCEFSPDGGHTWQAEQHVSFGALGDYVGPVDFWDFANGYDVRARIKCTDPVFVSLFDGQVDMEAAGF